MKRRKKTSKVWKIDKQEFENIVKTSTTFSSIMKNIGLSPKGGNINTEGNSLMVDSSKNHKQWYQHIKRLINNPELVKQLSENLYDMVKDTYSIQAVTETRAEWYKSLIKK